MRCTSFDLPVVEPIAKRTIEAAGLGGRVAAAGGDFFADPLPDALDAITTDRPYRPAASMAEAREAIAKAAGTQFDPRVVEALVRVI